MAEFPALTLWTDAYLSDTRHLSTLEHGAYFLLLMEAWRRPICALPDDDKILSRLCGLTLPEWVEIKPIVMEFWKLDGRSKTWSQKRLSLERDRARVRSTSARSNSSKRWNKTENDDAPALPLEYENDARASNATTATATATEEEKKRDATASPKKGLRIPQDWNPKPLPRSVASLVALWPPGRLERELEGFRDYWSSRSSQATKLDWDKTWHNRIRDQHDRIMRELKNGNGHHPQRPSQIALIAAGAQRRAHSRDQGIEPDLPPDDAEF